MRTIDRAQLWKNIVSTVAYATFVGGGLLLLTSVHEVDGGHSPWDSLLYRLPVILGGAVTGGMFGFHFARRRLDA
jgi:hypothetical protein